MLFTFLAMLFCHVLDDYVLQGFLSKGKQKMWWKSQDNYKHMYGHDYIVCIIMHSIEWSFMIMLPIAFLCDLDVSWIFGLVFAFNVAIHAITDHVKANRLAINLVTDQIIHICQIILTFLILVVI